MDKTEKLRLALTNLVAENMGKEAGRLFYGFHIDDDVDAVIDGAKALLFPLMGQTMADKKIEEVRKSL